MKKWLLILMMITSVCSFSCSAESHRSLVSDNVRSGDDIYIEGHTFEENIDFTSMKKDVPVTEGIRQVRINSTIVFKNCTFNGKVLFYKKSENNEQIVSTVFGSLSFINCRFSEEVSLRGCHIYGDTYFLSCGFEKQVSFEDGTFYQNAYFDKTVFHSDTRFQNACFIQKTSFMESVFNTTASFQSVKFNADAQFSVSRFKGYADFSLISCNHHVYFNYATFDAKSIFNNAFFGRDANFVQTVFTKGAFKHCIVSGDGNFHKAKGIESIQFDQCRFMGGQPDILKKKEKDQGKE